MSWGLCTPPHARAKFPASSLLHSLHHMVTKAPPKKQPQRAARKRSQKIAAGTTEPGVTGMAGARSIKVADEIAAGKRNIPEEQYDDLPPNATPLDILIMAMRRAYLLGGSIAAAPYAEKAAPYLHGKISSIELKNPLGGGAAPGESGKPIPFRIEFVDPPAPKDTP